MSCFRIANNFTVSETLLTLLEVMCNILSLTKTQIHVNTRKMHTSRTHVSGDGV